jgi:uncharacterized surface protein with fasciclin (FAS1) repeats
MTLADALISNPSLGKFWQLVSACGLESLLRSPGPYTLFAPTNEAFAHLAAETMRELDEPRRLREVVEYHMLDGKRDRSAFASSKLKTLQGSMISAGVTDDGLTIDHANSRGRPITCTNGVIHPIDAVLLPGFLPAVSDEARADSAWSGRRATRLAPAEDPSWPFIEPKPPGKSPSAS